MSSFRLSSRGWRAVFLTLLTIIILEAFPYNRSLIHTLIIEHRYPPLYQHFREREDNLPHYAAYEQSSTIKYLWTPNHPRHVGWGNNMQDYVTSALLAYAANRSFVFDDYAWEPTGSQYSYFGGKLIPSRIPLSAILEGPIVGGELSEGDSAPRAVSEAFFHRICPNPTIVFPSDVNYDGDATVETIIHNWVEYLNSIEDPCVQFSNEEWQVLGVGWYSDKNRMLHGWPRFAKSPLLAQWGWSPLVREAFLKNLLLLFPSTMKSVAEGSLPDILSDTYTQPIPGLLVMHVRRGDFVDHCRHLNKVHYDWHAFNSFPEFLDKIDASADLETNTPHCYPTITQMVEKVNQVKAESTVPLTDIYIMTNGAPSWVEDLKRALHEAGEWEHIGSSRELALSWEQKFIVQALDMFVAQRAQVIIGNGWSSLTSNIVMLRMARGLPTESNRFW
ncbi:hypothetical protein HYDPIDRAFT_127451 [Hydnomerulius pinastri MD-312]|nr:hypothetical protein HYDPIDRAFT_127451 [Hydnomerulius pinastri MD-312]